LSPVERPGTLKVALNEPRYRGMISSLRISFLSLVGNLLKHHSEASEHRRELLSRVSTNWDTATFRSGIGEHERIAHVLRFNGATGPNSRGEPV